MPVVVGEDARRRAPNAGKEANLQGVEAQSTDSEKPTPVEILTRVERTKTHRRKKPPGRYALSELTKHRALEAVGANAPAPCVNKPREG